MITARSARAFGRQAWRRTRWWAPLTALALLAAIAASIFAAVAWERSVDGQARRSFDAESAGVASTVSTAVQRLQDLNGSLAADYAQNPGLTTNQFKQWTATIDVAKRYPGVVAFGAEAVVRHADLDQFLAQHPRPFENGTPLNRALLGDHPFYCLGQAGALVHPSHLIASMASANLCAFPEIAPLFLSSRDTGHAVTLAFGDSGGGPAYFFVNQPVYRTGVAPSTVAARRAAIVGWMEGLFDARRILATALSGHPGMGVKLTRIEAGGDESSQVAALGVVKGKGLHHRQLRVTADGSWSLDLYGRANHGTSPMVQGLAVLAGCLALIGLMSALLFVLARGRKRALRLVDAKTDQLRYQALHDALTGLPNRALVLDRTEHALARSRRDGHVPAALFIDLDGFKGINDTLGHAAGDNLLRAFAERLTAVMRDGDTVGRLGGDEFVVLIDGTGPKSNAELVAQRILDVLREPFCLPSFDGTFTVTASIGVAEGDRETADDLLRDADIALYQAKGAGRDCYVRFAPEMQDALHDRIVLERDLRAAVGSDQLYLVFQPTVDLTTLDVMGVEALLRWRHPTRGLLGPNLFIPIAEETGLICDMGRWVLDQACETAAGWHTQGYSVAISVNVSARQLEAASFCDDVALALQASGLDPAYLILEITETTLMRDPAVAAELLHRIKALGVRIAIDDFGTGYSSLAYLQQLPVDTLKIDRTFVAGIAQSREADALIHTLVQLGKTLGLTTLAEGIEDDSQLSHVRQAACDSGQGYLFGRPMDIAMIESFLESTCASKQLESVRD